MAAEHHTCKICEFYRGELIGQCRRYPQHVAKHHSEWCGEFKQTTSNVVDITKRRGRPPKVAA